jgi:hypothetical protein
MFVRDSFPELLCKFTRNRYNSLDYVYYLTIINNI